MSDDQILIEVAKLDDPDHHWEIHKDIFTLATKPYKKLVGYRYPAHSGWIDCKPYLTSRDAIVPVIEKQFSNDTQRSDFICTLGDVCRSENKNWWA